jgi:hypothetical protein
MERGDADRQRGEAKGQPFRHCSNFLKSINFVNPENIKILIFNKLYSTLFNHKVLINRRTPTFASAF